MKTWLQYKDMTWLPVPRCGSRSVLTAVAKASGNPLMSDQKPHNTYLSLAWPNFWTYGGTLPEGKLAVIVRNPLERFISCLYMWNKNYPLETLENIIHHAEHGSTENHTASVDSLVNGLLSGRQDDVVFLKIEEVQSWASDYGFKVPHLEHSKTVNKTKLTPDQIERVKAAYAADYKLLNYEY